MSLGLTGRDRGRHAAVHAGIDEVDGALPRCEVAEHRMHVRIDESRHHGGAARVDHRVGMLVEPAPDRGDTPVANDE
jgi:hypothetical protein